jgi:hypothetical protein
MLKRLVCRDIMHLFLLLWLSPSLLLPRHHSHNRNPVYHSQIRASQVSRLRYCGRNNPIDLLPSVRILEVGIWLGFSRSVQRTLRCEDS